MARSTYTPPPPAGPPTALLVITGAIGLISAIATIVALMRSNSVAPLACAAEQAGLMDKLKAAQFAKDAIAKGATDPWKIAADGWASLLACPGLPGSFTKGTPPDRVKLFAASVLYVVDLLRGADKITEAQKTMFAAEVATWATGLGVTI